MLYHHFLFVPALHLLPPQALRQALHLALLALPAFVAVVVVPPQALVMVLVRSVFQAALPLGLLDSLLV